MVSVVGSNRLKTDVEGTNFCTVYWVI